MVSGHKSSTSGRSRGGGDSGSTSLSVNIQKQISPVKERENSNASSPDNNNYSGQHQAYKYQSLNETPSSPELANHRGRKTPVSPPVTPEIIQVGLK